jgi:peptidoglycan/LPS O-acetylase OafA/YrhL
MTRSENDDTYDLEPEQAMNDLGTANRSADRARGQGWRWVRTYLLVWALASVGLIIGLGIGNKAVTIGIFIGWTILSLAGGIWSRSRGLTPRGGGRRIGRAAGLWAACYAIVLAVGVTRQTQSTGFWIAAAVFTAAPLVVAALIPAPKAADVS